MQKSNSEVEDTTPDVPHPALSQNSSFSFSAMILPKSADYSVIMGLADGSSFELEWYTHVIGWVEC
jgi:hypothetical protein